MGAGVGGLQAKALATSTTRARMIKVLCLLNIFSSWRPVKHVAVTCFLITPEKQIPAEPKVSRLAAAVGGLDGDVVHNLSASCCGKLEEI
jgi:hypothetical protein